MKIPKKIKKHGKIFTFVQRCNDKLFLYQDDNGFKESFTLFDLRRIDNSAIDELIKKPRINYYERNFNFIYHVINLKTKEDKEYSNIEDIVKDLGLSRSYILYAIKEHKRLKYQYYIRKEIKNGNKRKIAN